MKPKKQPRKRAPCREWAGATEIINRLTNNQNQYSVEVGDLKRELAAARDNAMELRADRRTAWDRNRDLQAMADAVVSVLCRALERTQIDLHNSDDAKDSYIRSYAQTSKESRELLLAMKPRVCNVRYMGEGTFEKLLKLWTMELPEGKCKV